MKRKMLVMSAHPPLSKSKEAGQKVFFHFLRDLSEYFEIHLLTFVRQEELEWGFEDCYPFCKLVEMVELRVLQKMLSVLNKPLVPFIYSARSNREFRQKLHRLLALHDYDAVHFEWEQMVQYLDHVRQIPQKTVTCHDVISQMYERKAQRGLSRWLYHFQYKKTLQMQREYLQLFDVIFTLNNKDKYVLHQLDGQLNVEVMIPFFHQELQDHIERLPKKYDLVFFGAMNRLENEQAVLWFLNHILPRVERTDPEIRVLVIGNNPSARVKRAAANRNVKVTGFVADPYQLIRESRLGIVPLQLGAGIKIKTLEFLGCGIPVVATTIGAEGIDAATKEGLYIEDHEEGFANRVVNLLSDPAYLEQVGDCAARYMEVNYDYRLNRNKIENAYGVTVRD